MTTETTAAPAAEAAPVAASTATAALFGDPPSAAAPAAAEPAAALTAEEQAAADAAKAAEPAPLKMPGKDATAEEWAAFYGALGRPETAEGYEIPLPEGDDGAFAKQMTPILHKHGVTAEQAKGLASDWNAMVAAQQAEVAAQDAAYIKQMDTQNKAEQAELANEWGQQATANTEMARRAIQQFLPGEKARDAIAALESVIGYKETIKFFHGVGKGLGEHDAAGMGTPQGQPAERKPLEQRIWGSS